MQGVTRDEFITVMPHSWYTAVTEGKTEFDVLGESDNNMEHLGDSIVTQMLEKVICFHFF